MDIDIRTKRLQELCAATWRQRGEREAPHRPGLSEKKLQKLEEKTGDLPATLREYLTVQDGLEVPHHVYKRLAGSEELAPKFQKRHQRALTKRDPDMEVDGLIVAFNPDSLSVAYLDQRASRNDAGEWPVIEVSGGYRSGEHASYAEFLASLDYRLIQELGAEELHRLAEDGHPSFRREFEGLNKTRASLGRVARPMVGLRRFRIGRRSSKVGGLPFWPAKKKWPTNADGEPLEFLLQLRAKDIPELSAPSGKDILVMFHDGQPDVETALEDVGDDYPLTTFWMSTKDDSTLVERSDAPRSRVETDDRGEPLEERQLVFEQIIDFPALWDFDPDVEQIAIDVRASVEEVQTYLEQLEEELEPYGASKIGGHPSWRQGVREPAARGTWSYVLQLAEPIVVGGDSLTVMVFADRRGRLRATYGVS